VPWRFRSADTVAVPWGLIGLVLTSCPREPAAATDSDWALELRLAIVSETGPAPMLAGDTETRVSVMATLRLTWVAGGVWLAKCEEPQAHNETAVAVAIPIQVLRWDTRLQAEV
jgi:hypothetical protein